MNCGATRNASFLRYCQECQVGQQILLPLSINASFIAYGADDLRQAWRRCGRALCEQRSRRGGGWGCEVGGAGELLSTKRHRKKQKTELLSASSR